MESLRSKGSDLHNHPREPCAGNPPVPFISTSPQSATSLGPSCLQQFPFADAALFEALFNNGVNGPPAENEDCLFLNVWAPAAASATNRVPVLVWIYGGALSFGTASLPAYDGTSIAANQGIILVTFNYRTNVFGFPGSPDLPLPGNNLGFLDQGGACPSMGSDEYRQVRGKSSPSNDNGSICGISVGQLFHCKAYRERRTLPSRDNALRGASIHATYPIFHIIQQLFDGGWVHASAWAGAARMLEAGACECYPDLYQWTHQWLLCASRRWVLSPVFSDPLLRIRTGLTARVPFIIGNTQNDGSVFAVGLNDLNAFLTTTFLGLITAAEVRPLYPGLTSDNAIIAEIIKDVEFLCPAELWSNAAVGAGIPNVFRYTYGMFSTQRTFFHPTDWTRIPGPVFADLQLFPNAGAWHSTELPEIFGTFNATTASAAEVALSKTMQTLVGNFVKNPTVSPASNWPKYFPGPLTTTLAKLAYNGNVAPTNVVQAVESDSIDGPCNAFWNTFLDVRE
ncbi:Carboxylic ester hydrolase [Mycena venus]|uniref:Carboxylic ester hydrolase n=1 Tax=Mycena venus TaxID=2733690 RepID=A0A8H7CL78_9AGAR|nr:Carboxylic ester hydrolase [Mycena venus]